MPRFECRNSEITGCVFNIQRFSLDDGPGIRTTVFLKGCNLRCLWCHNPESVRFAPEPLYYAGKCAGCGSCAAVCPERAVSLGDGGLIKVDRRRCVGCGRCEAVCVHGALRVAGKLLSAGDVAAEVIRDRVFYETSGGGVTFSGGEPLMQPDFLLECLELCRAAGLHTAVDTAGNVPASVFDTLRDLPDLYLYDIKLANSERHAAAAGVDNKLILANFKRLAAGGARIQVRVPVIPGINDSADELRGIAAVIRAAGGVGQVRLLRYHALGDGKRVAMGVDNAFSPEHIVPESEMERFAGIFRDLLPDSEILL